MLSFTRLNNVYDKLVWRSPHFDALVCPFRIPPIQMMPKHTGAIHHLYTSSGRLDLEKSFVWSFSLSLRVRIPWTWVSRLFFVISSVFSRILMDCLLFLHDVPVQSFRDIAVCYPRYLWPLLWRTGRYVFSVKSIGNCIVCILDNCKRIYESDLPMIFQRSAYEVDFCRPIALVIVRWQL